MKKVCTKCSFPKDLSLFNKKGKGLDTWCKQCRSDYWTKWYAVPDNKANHISRNVSLTKLHKKKMRDLVWSLKDKPCADCGHKYSPWIMQFDHLPGFVKDATVQFMWTNGYSEERIRAEVAKCEVVCANCHADRTYKRTGLVLGDD